MNMRNKFFSYLIGGILTGLLSTGVHAEDAPWKFSLGGKLHFAGWSGDNDATATDFEANARQLRLNARLSKGRFYTGLGLQGASFKFKDDAPDMVNKTTVTPASDVTVNRGESDLIVGYYFFERVSFFLDLKSISLDYENQDYKLTSSGLGFGANGYAPLNPQWLFYWSVGVFSLGADHKGDSIGNTKGSGTELGFLYRVSPQFNFSISLKGQNTKYEFDQGSEQTHRTGGLALGASYTF